MPIKEFNIYDVWHPVYYLHHESFLRPLKMWVRFILIRFLPHFNLFFVWKPMRFIKVFVNQQKKPCFQNTFTCFLPFYNQNSNSSAWSWQRVHRWHGRHAQRLPRLWLLHKCHGELACFKAILCVYHLICNYLFWRRLESWMWMDAAMFLTHFSTGWVIVNCLGQHC